MTSQIAVANHNGVAVASDTVVTHFSEIGAKTIGNQKKIIEIGKKHRVVILNSGAVTQNGVTTKLLIKEWSSTLDNPLPTLSEYVDSFVDWMNQENKIHTVTSENNRVAFLLDDHFSEVKKRAINHWNRIPIEEEKFTSREEILTDYAILGIEYLNSLSLNFEIVDDLAFKNVVESDEIDINEIIDYHFSDLGLTADNTEILIQSAHLVLSRNQDFPGRSTFGFVGFGQDEYFAGSIRLHATGFYGNRFIYNREDRFAVDPEEGTAIMPFAQSDAILGFIKGIRPEIQTHVWHMVRNKVNDAITNPTGEDLGEKIANEVSQSVTDFCIENLQNPLLESIEGLDLIHLANLAESLVGMQATSAFGAEGPATVGGFIEVVTIDRQDGVAWIKSVQ